MAGDWDVVENKPVSEWDVVSSTPAAPAGRPGEIPETQAAATPREAPGIMERIRGLNLKAVGEMVIDQALGAIGGTVGGLGGLAGGVAGALHQAADRRAQPEGGVGRSVMEGAQRGAEAMKQSYYGLPLVGQPSAKGQEYSEAVGEFIGQNAPAGIAGPGGVVGLARQAPKGAMGTGLRAATDAAAGSKVAEAARTGAAAVADSAVRAVSPTLEPRTMQRLETAYKADVPVSPHQVSGNKFVKMLGEFAEQVPNAGGAGLKQSRRDKLSGALASMIDENANARVLDDATFKSLQDTAGAKIGEIYEKAPDVPRDAFGDLMKTVQDNDPAIRDTIARFVTQIDEAAEQHGGAIPGPTLREMRTRAAAQARETASGKADLSAAWNRVVKRLDDGLEQVLPEEDLPVLFQARKSYAISKALEPLVAKHPDGNFPASALHSIATNTAKKKTRMARGEAGEMGDYSELGREVLKETVTSNTAERQLLYSVLKGEAAEKPGLLLGSTMWAGAGLYNLLGPRLLKRVYEAQKRRNAPKPEGPPPEPTLGAGFEDVPQGQPPAKASPLGDLTPDWETAPGATDHAPGEVVPTEGLVPAVDEARPMRVQPAGAAPEAEGAALRGAGEQIPAVPGRPDLPDTMVAGAPTEVGATQATGEAMQAPEAALARQRQAEALQQRAQAVQSPEVRRVLETQAAKLALEAKRMKDAHDLRMEAAVTDDPAIRQALLDHAKRLERAEKVAVGEAKEGMPKEKPAKVEKIPAGEATEVAPDVVEPIGPLPVGEAYEVWGGKRIKDKIPVGEATELPVEVVSDDAKNAQFETLRKKLNEQGLSSEEYAEMDRLDPSKASPEEAQAKAAEIGVPNEWLQERRHMVKEGKSNAEILAQHDWEKASDRLMAAHDWKMAGRDAESEIRERISMKLGTARIRKDPVGFTRKVIDAMNAEAERLEKERATPGTLSHRREQKRVKAQAAETVAAMTKAMFDELRSLSSELDEMRAKGRITDAEYTNAISQVRKVKTHDDLEGAIDYVDSLVDSKTVRSDVAFVKDRGPSANQKFEVGKTYVDANGNRAIYQADGTWKPVR